MLSGFASQASVVLSSTLVDFLPRRKNTDSEKTHGFYTRQLFVLLSVISPQINSETLATSNSNIYTW